MKKIVMTGGGTAGHVTPNIALMPALKEAGYDIEYIGSVNGMEKGLIEAQKIPYHGISSGKLRRYFDWKNFTDPFRVLKGYGQAVSLMKKLKPDVVFSKGGFVSVPVVLAAKHCHVPAIIHESDITPGLANKIAIKGAKKVCCNFPETMKYLPADKAVLTGSPIRRELFSGVAENAIKLCNFPDHNKPVILIIGGSLGSKKVNGAVREILPELLKDFYVIHLCGKGNLDNKLAGITGYAQFEYANAELTDMFALADMAISRAGANSICELLALHKPNILIPLSAAASRGDQVLNAKSFKKQGFSYVIEEEELTKDSLLSAVKEVYGNRDKYKDAMAKSGQMDSICGKGNLDNKLAGITGYAQFEYANAELTDMFALADMAISRAGANSICELLALHKPNILIPLSAAASRGDQVLNAKSFKKQGFSYVIEEEELTKDSLLSAVKEVYGNRDKYKDAMAKSGQMDSIATIIDLINSQVKKSS